MDEEEALALGWFFEEEEFEGEKQKKCPKCGSKLVSSLKKRYVKVFKYKRCEYVWKEP